MRRLSPLCRDYAASVYYEWLPDNGNHIALKRGQNEKKNVALRPAFGTAYPAAWPRCPLSGANAPFFSLASISGLCGLPSSPSNHPTDRPTASNEFNLSSGLLYEASQTPGLITPISREIRRKVRRRFSLVLPLLGTPSLLKTISRENHL